MYLKKLLLSVSEYVTVVMKLHRVAYRLFRIWWKPSKGSSKSKDFSKHLQRYLVSDSLVTRPRIRQHSSITDTLTVRYPNVKPLHDITGLRNNPTPSQRAGQSHHSHNRKDKRPNSTRSTESRSRPPAAKKPRSGRVEATGTRSSPRTRSPQKQTMTKTIKTAKK